MNILVSGATGFIGRQLTARLNRDGHSLVILSRNAQQASLHFNFPCQTVQCDLMQGPPPSEAFLNVDAVIHLAGESIASGRWTAEQRKKIHDSRVRGTRNLVEGLKASLIKPHTWIAVSAVGIYGNQGDEVLTENSKTGHGFLADVCREWEFESNRAKSQDTRVALLRLGMVLGQGGGALAPMHSPFSLGLGAKLGPGRQWMSWIHLDDVIEAICYALNNRQVTGPLNGVAPQPITNSEFTQTLAKVLNKKAFLTLPTPLLRFTLGEMADLLLFSARVLPVQLESLGFKFAYPTLLEALRQIYPSRNSRT